jgi:hypothetical protein
MLAEGSGKRLRLTRQISSPPVLAIALDELSTLVEDRDEGAWSGQQFRGKPRQLIELTVPFRVEQPGLSNGGKPLWIGEFRRLDDAHSSSLIAKRLQGKMNSSAEISVANGAV